MEQEQILNQCRNIARRKGLKIIKAKADGFLHTYFSDLNDDAQYSFFDENHNALDELHRATNAMELVRKAYPDTIRQTGSI